MAPPRGTVSRGQSNDTLPILSPNHNSTKDADQLQKTLGELSRARAENDKLTRELTTVKQQMEENRLHAREQVDELERQQKSSVQQLDQLKQDLAAREEELVATDKFMAGSKERIAKLETELEALKQHLSDSEDQIVTQE